MSTPPTLQEQRERLTQSVERALQPHHDEFVRRTTELFKQSDRYKEHMKRKEAEEKGPKEPGT